MGKTFEKFKFDEVLSSKYTIENFIVFEGEKIPIKLFADHPFLYEGIAFTTCLKGKGHVKINFKEYVVEENCLLTLTPSHIIEPLDHSEDLLLTGLVFSQDAMLDLPLPIDINILEKVISNPILKVSKEDLKKITAYHSFILDIFNNNTQLYLRDIIKGLLFSLIYQVVALYGENEPERNKQTSRNEDIVESFFRLLKEHYMTERSPGFYAGKLCITTKYLSSILKNVTGRSINSWLEEAIILGAKLMLKTTELTVLQISEELNFPNPSYFGRYFKKAVGMTPKEYRDS